MLFFWYRFVTKLTHNAVILQNYLLYNHVQIQKTTSLLSQRSERPNHSLHFPQHLSILKIAFCITWFQEILEEQRLSALDIFSFKCVSKAFGGSSKCASWLFLSKNLLLIHACRNKAA